MNEKPTIYIISGKNPLAARSGYPAYSYNLAKVITVLGYKVKIFCIGLKNEVVKDAIGEIHIVKSSLLRLPFLQDLEMAGLPIFSLQIALALLKAIKNDRKVMFWGIGPWGLPAALLKILPTGKKFTFLAYYPTTMKHEFRETLSAINIKDYGILIKLQTVMTYYTIIQLYTLLEKFILDKSDKIITHYLSSEKILSKQFNIKKSKFLRISYNVDLIKRSFLLNHIKQPIPAKPLIILVCRHDGRKGINYLLHAFSVLNKQKVKYSATIIGAGRLLVHHQKLAQKLGLKNVFMFGFIPDIKPFMSNATLYVFPSVEEGASALSILDAMKEGLPIVSTNVDGIPEDIEDNKSGLLVPPKNPTALADAIGKLLKNPTLAKRLGHQAKIRYQQKFNLTRVRNDIDKVLNQFS